MIITLKSGPLAGTQMLDVVAVAKGLIDAKDLASGGELRPQEADKLITMLYADTFLSRINTVRMRRLTRQIDVMDIMARRLVRVAEGAKPSNAEMTSASEYGCLLTALPVQLFAGLTLSFLRENASNKNLQSEIEKGFNTVLTNDIVRLGFEGVADDNTGADREARFNRLNKGWLQIARESGDTPKPAIDPATDGWKATLKIVTEAGDIRARDMSVYVMSTSDADAYSDEINAPVTGHETATGSPARRFDGREIVAHPMMPKGKVLFTPLKNLAHGVHTIIDRNRHYDADARTLRYVFDMALDFEIAVKQFAVLGE